MKSIYLAVIVGSLLSCGGGGGDDAPVANIPVVNPGDSNCDGDVSFNTVVPDAPVDMPAVDVPAVDAPGVINPAVMKAVDAADSQGLRIIRMEKLDGTTIIVTCGSTVNIGGDPVTTNNNPAPVK